LRDTKKYLEDLRDTKLDTTTLEGQFYLERLTADLERVKKAILDLGNEIK
jgi:hypothetical protein